MPVLLNHLPIENRMMELLYICNRESPLRKRCLRNREIHYAV